MVRVSLRQSLSDPTGKSISESFAFKRVKSNRAGARLVATPSQQAAWSSARRLAYKVVNGPQFEISMLLIIFLNVGFVVFDTDRRAHGHDVAEGKYVDRGFLVIYLCEVAFRFFGVRHDFFRHPLNIMDLIVVAIDLVGQLSFDALKTRPPISTLRICRVIRMLKLLRSNQSFRELWLMLHGLRSALKAIFWACILMSILLVIMSVAMVELIHPINKELVDAGYFDDHDCLICPDAFSSVLNSFFSLFLLVFMGDLWTDLAVPIMRREPWTAAVFMVAFVTISLGVLNLILAVIVDRAEQARSDDAEQKAIEKKNEFRKATGLLMEICVDMDTDESGTLSFEEVVTGYDKIPEFKEALNLMDVYKEDLATVFGFLDDDRSGAVTCEEFVRQLYKMKTQDAHTLLVFIKQYVMNLHTKIEDEVRMMKEVMHDKSRETAQLVHDMSVVLRNLQVMEARESAKCCREQDVQDYRQNGGSWQSCEARNVASFVSAVAVPVEDDCSGEMSPTPSSARSLTGVPESESRANPKIVVDLVDCPNKAHSKRDCSKQEALVLDGIQPAIDADIKSSEGPGQLTVPVRPHEEWVPEPDPAPSPIPIW